MMEAEDVRRGLKKAPKVKTEEEKLHSIGEEIANKDAMSEKQIEQMFEDEGSKVSPTEVKSLVKKLVDSKQSRFKRDNKGRIYLADNDE